ncbi:hypothetical protein BJY00DRAFT_296930, partial [Aspergillus carlsbadensis]
MCVFKIWWSYSDDLQVDECHPLFLAIQNGHPEVAMTLLNAGATFIDTSVIQVTAAYGPPNVILHILGESEVSEDHLIRAARTNITHRLYPCPRKPSTYPNRHKLL